MKSLGALIHLACCIKNHNKSAVSDIYLCALCVCVCSMHVCVCLYWACQVSHALCIVLTSGSGDPKMYATLLLQCACMTAYACVCGSLFAYMCVCVCLCVCVCACARVFEVKINKKSCKRRIKRISLSSLSIQSKISDRIRIHITLIGFSWKMLTLYLKINERKKHHNHTAC